MPGFTYLSDIQINREQPISFVDLMFLGLYSIIVNMYGIMEQWCSDPGLDARFQGKREFV